MFAKVNGVGFQQILGDAEGVTLEELSQAFHDRFLFERPPMNKLRPCEIMNFRHPKREDFESVDSVSLLRRLSGRAGPPDVICQTRTLSAPGADATASRQVDGRR